MMISVSEALVQEIRKTYNDKVRAPTGMGPDSKNKKKLEEYRQATLKQLRRLRRKRGEVAGSSLETGPRRSRDEDQGDDDSDSEMYTDAHSFQESTGTGNEALGENAPASKTMTWEDDIIGHGSTEVVIPQRSSSSGCLANGTKDRSKFRRVHFEMPVPSIDEVLSAYTEEVESKDAAQQTDLTSLAMAAITVEQLLSADADAALEEEKREIKPITSRGVQVEQPHDDEKYRAQNLLAPVDQGSKLESTLNETKPYSHDVPQGITTYKEEDHGDEEQFVSCDESSVQEPQDDRREGTTPTELYCQRKTPSPTDRKKIISDTTKSERYAYLVRLRQDEGQPQAPEPTDPTSSDDEDDDDEEEEATIFEDRSMSDKGKGLEPYHENWQAHPRWTSEMDDDAHSLLMENLRLHYELEELKAMIINHEEALACIYNSSGTEHGGGPPPSPSLMSNKKPRPTMEEPIPPQSVVTLAGKTTLRGFNLRRLFSSHLILDVTVHPDMAEDDRSVRVTLDVPLAMAQIQDFGQIRRDMKIGGKNLGRRYSRAHQESPGALKRGGKKQPLYNSSNKRPVSWSSAASSQALARHRRGVTVV